MLTFETLLKRELNARHLGAVRIGFGLVVLVKGIDILDRYDQVTGSRRSRYFPDLPDLFFSGADVIVPAVWILLALALVFGIRPRYAAALLPCVVTFLLLADKRFFNQHIYLIGILGMLLAISRCDAALALLPGMRSPVVREWPVFLMKCELSIVYFFAALSKVNADFLVGNVVHHTAMRNPMAVALLPASAREHVLLNGGLGIFTVFTEFLLAFGLWFRGTRAAALTIGCMFHLGMLLFMPRSAFHAVRLGVFGLVLMALYPLFIESPSEGRTLRFDPRSSGARRAVALLRVLDWSRLIRFEPIADAERAERAEHPLVLTDLDGAVYTGRSALLSALSVLPLTCYGAGLFRVLSRRTKSTEAGVAVPGSAPSRA